MAADGDEPISDQEKVSIYLQGDYYPSILSFITLSYTYL